MKLITAFPVNMPFKPNDITREHIIEAIAKIERDRILLKPSTHYDVIVDGKTFPPLEVLRYAHEQLDGDKRWELPAGEQTFRILKRLGFDVVKKVIEKQEKSQTNELSTPRIWFVCQGGTFNERQGKKYLFASNSGKDGRSIPHWTNVTLVRPGDIIFNYASKAVRGVSIAKESKAENNGTKVDINFCEFEQPLVYDPTYPWCVEVKRLTNSINGPIDATGRIKQGYLFEFNLDAAKEIRSAYGKKFPDSIEKLFSSNLTTRVTAVDKAKSLNSILYGPPGTGKTYNSIEKAVELADGSLGDDRNKIKERFDELRAEGRIEFVTFHQNYSYEDFMVGIRPDVDNEELRFQAQKGIFYRIARRARDNYEESLIGRGRRSFDEVLSEILAPLESGKEVPVKMASGISFRITGVSEKSIDFIKQSGGKDHTLSISTLRDVAEGVRDVPGGLDSYYKPFVRLINEKRVTSEPAEKRKEFVLVIDEINRANISRVFGELITLLEDDKRIGAKNELRVTLPNGEKDFGIPPNLYVIGTMNTADKSIALIDIALRRRFEFIGYYPRYDLIDGDAQQLLRSINDKIYAIKKSADFLIGHAYFMTALDIETVVKNKVIPLLMEYLGGKIETVEEIFSGTAWNVRFNTETYQWDVSRK